MLHDPIFRLRALFRHRRVEDDMQEELQYHLERQSEKYVQAGSTPEEASRKARIALGGPEQIGQQCREARGTRFVEFHPVFGPSECSVAAGWLLPANPDCD